MKAETFDCCHCNATRPLAQAAATTAENEHLCGECVRKATADREPQPQPQPQPHDPTRES